MFLSSGELVVGLMEGAFAEHGVEDVAAPAGERDEGSVVATVEAAGMQLRAGLGSDVIITMPGGVTAKQAAAVTSTPGIDAVVAGSTVPAEVTSTPRVPLPRGSRPACAPCSAPS